MEGCASQAQGMKQDGQMVDYLGCWSPPDGPLLVIGTGPDKETSPQNGRVINPGNLKNGKNENCPEKVRMDESILSSRRQSRERSQIAGKLLRVSDGVQWNWKQRPIAMETLT